MYHGVFYAERSNEKETDGRSSKTLGSFRGKNLKTPIAVWARYI